MTRCVQCYMKQNIVEVSLYLRCAKCGGMEEHKTIILCDKRKTIIRCWDCYNRKVNEDLK